MTPQMVETLYRISLLYAPDPETVFQQIVDAVAEMYGNTMAMVNIVEGDCLRYRAIANPHPAFKNIRTLDLQLTLCQFALRTMRPLLVQNAVEHPDFRRHMIVKLKLRRYLGVPICSSSGSTVGTLCFLDDYTEQTLGEEDIQFLSLLAMRVSAELERERLIEARVAEQRAHAERLAALNLRLQETAEEKRLFVSMVIHDLRHPLTTLRTSLYLLRIEPDRKQRLAHLNALENRTRALSTLLDELVLYDQIEAGRPLFKIEEIDLSVLIRACVDEVAGLTGELAVPIHCEIAPDLGIAHIDGSKLKHILLNLLANALKFTPEGRIVVRACAVGADRWRLEVEDTGIGMTSLEQQHAFEEYFSGAKAAEGGVGLGLAIARRLCMVLKAQVVLESAPGHGTRFQIVFPRQSVPCPTGTQISENESRTETRPFQTEMKSLAGDFEEQPRRQAEALQAAQKEVLTAVQMRAVGTLAMGIAHDLRNILTTLQLEIAESAPPSHQASVYRQLDRLYVLTHSLLALSDETQVHSGPVDVSEIIDFVLRLVRGQAAVDGASLRKRVPCTAPFVLGNPRRLEQLFVNLLLNALNAVASTGGAITVVVRRVVGNIRVDVRDTGPGIEPEHLPQLFEPFFTTRANRTGLGLFSARRIVEAHQGKITISSEVGKGTCVSVWLPAADTAPAPVESGQHDASSPITSGQKEST